MGFSCLSFLRSRITGVYLCNEHFKVLPAVPEQAPILLKAILASRKWFSLADNEDSRPREWW